MMSCPNCKNKLYINDTVIETGDIRSVKCIICNSVFDYESFMKGLRMKDWHKEACESIDAGFFSSDAFHNKIAIEEISFYIGRWLREIEHIKKILAEDEAKENEVSNK